MVSGAMVEPPLRNRAVSFATLRGAVAPALERERHDALGALAKSMTS